MPEAVEHDLARLEPEDLPILGMRMKEATLSEIASVLHLDEQDLSPRLVAMVERLAARVGGATAA